MLKRIMSRQELLRRLSTDTKLEESSVTRLLEGFAQIAGEEVKLNGAFILPGIGFIQRRERQERTGKNPKTGEAMRIVAEATLTLEFGSRFEQVVLVSRPEREGTLTTALWSAPRAVLEAIERDGDTAKEWDTLTPKGFEVDADFTVFLDEYADLFAHLLKTEGLFDGDTMRGLSVGYVTPETVKDRSATLEGVDIEALGKAGHLDSNAAEEFGSRFLRLKEFVSKAAAQSEGIIVVVGLGA